MEYNTNDANKRPRIGMALGGGGARGLAHVGVLKVLDRVGLKPDVIAGTSMGGLIGGAYAAGFSARAIEREVLALATASRLVKLADRVPSLRALFSGKRFEEYLKRTLGADLTFADLRRPLAVSTVDLISGREVVFTEGPVVPALRASMSLPGVFATVETDGQRLADGGILNNVPADHARALGADIIVAVDVLPCFTGIAREMAPPEAATPLELPLAPAGLRDLWESAFISIGALTAYNFERSRPDLIVRPGCPTTITLLTGFTRAEEAIESGAKAMEASLPRLQQLIQQRSKELHRHDES